MGWAVKGFEFKFRYRQDFSFLHIVQSDSGDHLASYTMGNGGSFAAVKAAGA
jgi:hypothetical protein